MDNIADEIQKKNFEQRINIIKGFSNAVNEIPVSFDEFKKGLNGESFYSLSDLKKYTEDVIKKDNIDEIQKSKEILANLTCRNVLTKGGEFETFYFEKGQTDDEKVKIKKVMKEYKDGTLKTPSGNSVTDKDQAIAMSEAGISNNKKEKISKAIKSEYLEKDKESSKEDKTGKKSNHVEDHAKNTSDSALKKFIKNNPDDPNSEVAKKELEKRNSKTKKEEEKQSTADHSALIHTDAKRIAFEAGMSQKDFKSLHPLTKIELSKTHAKK